MTSDHEAIEELTAELRAVRQALGVVLTRLDRLDELARRERRKSRFHRAGSGLVLVLIVTVGILTFRALQEQERAERRTCEAVNDSKAVLLGVLTELAEEREDDAPGEFEERQRLLDRVTPLVQPIDCQETP